AWVLGDRLFYFKREDILTAHNDDVFHSIHDVVVPIVINARYIAGAVPGPNKGISGCFGVMEVLFHAGVGLEPDFAGFSPGGLGTVCFHYPHFESDHRVVADTSGLAQLVFWSEF